MKILEQILEEINDLIIHSAWPNMSMIEKEKVENIIRSHMEDDGWIAVEERVPEYYGTVWLSFTNQHSSYSRMAYWDGSYFRWCSNGIKVKDSPVAWKPFCAPEPYHPKED